MFLWISIELSISSILNLNITCQANSKIFTFTYFMNVFKYFNDLRHYNNSLNDLFKNLRNLNNFFNCCVNRNFSLFKSINNLDLLFDMVHNICIFFEFLNFNELFRHCWNFNDLSISILNLNYLLNLNRDLFDNLLSHWYFNNFIYIFFDNFMNFN